MAFYTLDDQHVRQLYDAGLNHLYEDVQPENKKPDAI